MHVEVHALMNVNVALYRLLSRSFRISTKTATDDASRLIVPLVHLLQEPHVSYLDERPSHVEDERKVDQRRNFIKPD